MLLDFKIENGNMNNEPGGPEVKDPITGKPENAIDYINSAREAAKIAAKEMCKCDCKCKTITFKVRLYGEKRLKNADGKINPLKDNFIGNFSYPQWAPSFKDMTFSCDDASSSEGF
jgi:hypothetical protein